MKVVSIPVEARKDVQVDMEHILTGCTTICQEQVDPLTFQSRAA